MKDQGKKCSVYCYYDRDDAPLYVGISSEVWWRAASHAQRAPWWQSVHYIQFFEAGSRVEANELETRLINSLRPANNKNKSFPRMLQKYRVMPEIHGRVFRHYLPGIRMRVRALTNEKFRQYRSTIAA